MRVPRRAAEKARVDVDGGVTCGFMDVEGHPFYDLSYPFRFSERKGRAMKRLSLCIVVLLLVSTFWGCGKEGVTETRTADVDTEVIPILEESFTAMSGLKGYRMRGYMEMSAGGEDASGSGTLRMDIESEVENVEGGTNQHMHVDMGGLTTEAYIYGDYFYQEVPGQGWIKTSLAQYQAQNLAAGVIDEEQMRLILESVQEATIGENDAGDTEVTLILGHDFLLGSLERFREEMGEGIEAQMEEWISAMEEASSGFSATLNLTIGKEDHLLRNMEMYLEMTNIPDLGSYRNRMFMEVFDYGADIHIELPEEALNARSQESLW